MVLGCLPCFSHPGGRGSTHGDNAEVKQDDDRARNGNGVTLHASPDPSNNSTHTSNRSRHSGSQQQPSVYEASSVPAILLRVYTQQQLSALSASPASLQHLVPLQHSSEQGDTSVRYLLPVSVDSTPPSHASHHRAITDCAALLKQRLRAETWAQHLKEQPSSKATHASSDNLATVLLSWADRFDPKQTSTPPPQHPPIRCWDSSTTRWEVHAALWASPSGSLEPVLVMECVQPGVGSALNALKQQKEQQQQEEGALTIVLPPPQEAEPASEEEGKLRTDSGSTTCEAGQHAQQQQKQQQHQQHAEQHRSFTKQSYRLSMLHLLTKGHAPPIKVPPKKGDSFSSSSMSCANVQRSPLRTDSSHMQGVFAGTPLLPSSPLNSNSRLPAALPNPARLPGSGLSNSSRLPQVLSPGSQPSPLAVQRSPGSAVESRATHSAHRNSPLLSGPALAKLTQPHSRSTGEMPPIHPPPAAADQLPHPLSFMCKTSSEWGSQAPLPSRMDTKVTLPIYARALAVLNQVSAIATLVDMRGRLIFQNEASLDYWGSLDVGVGSMQHSVRNSACSSNASRGAQPVLHTVLDLLLPNSPESSTELLLTVGAGCEWRRVLQVPSANIKRVSSMDKASSQRSHESFLSKFTEDSAGARRSYPHGGPQSAGGPGTVRAAPDAEDKQGPFSHDPSKQAPVDSFGLLANSYMQHLQQQEQQVQQGKARPQHTFSKQEKCLPKRSVSFVDPKLVRREFNPHLRGMKRQRSLMRRASTGTHGVVEAAHNFHNSILRQAGWGMEGSPKMGDGPNNRLSHRASAGEALQSVSSPQAHNLPKALSKGFPEKKATKPGSQEGTGSSSFSSCTPTSTAHGPAAPDSSRLAAQSTPPPPIPIERLPSKSYTQMAIEPSNRVMLLIQGKPKSKEDAGLTHRKSGRAKRPMDRANSCTDDFRALNQGRAVGQQLKPSKAMASADKGGRGERRSLGTHKFEIDGNGRVTTEDKPSGHLPSPFKLALHPGTEHAPRMSLQPMPEAVHESVEVAKLLSNSQGATLIESQHSSQMRSGSTAPRLPSDAQPNAAAFGSELPGVLPSDVATRTSVDHDDKCYLSFTGDVMASVSLSLPPHSSGQQQQQQQNPHLRRQQLQPPFYPDTFLRKPPLPHDQANDLQDTASPSFPTSSELPDLIATPMSPLSEKVTDTGTGMSSRSSMAKPMNPCWHEVCATAITDPATGQPALLLLQQDITDRAELEARIIALAESQLAMLEQMFPRHVLDFMVGQQRDVGTPKPDPAILANSHENVTILFTDIVGFTSMSKEVKPNQVMAYLNKLFSAFDELVDTYQIYKIEVAGDCYLAAGGLAKLDQDGFISMDPSPRPAEAAQRVLSFAKALLYCAKTVPMPHNGQPTQMRVGMHTGDVVTGLIGTKLPKYSVFGDTMNTASRMESTCPYGCIQVSTTTHALLPNYPFKPTGGVEVKGKGLMETYVMRLDGKGVEASGSHAVFTTPHAPSTIHKSNPVYESGSLASHPALATMKKVRSSQSLSKHPLSRDSQQEQSGLGVITYDSEGTALPSCSEEHEASKALARVQATLADNSGPLHYFGIMDFNHIRSSSAVSPIQSGSCLYQGRGGGVGGGVIFEGYEDEIMSASLARGGPPSGLGPSPPTTFSSVASAAAVAAAAAAPSPQQSSPRNNFFPVMHSVFIGNDPVASPNNHPPPTRSVSQRQQQPQLGRQELRASVQSASIHSGSLFGHLATARGQPLSNKPPEPFLASSSSSRLIGAQNPRLDRVSSSRGKSGPGFLMTTISGGSEGQGAETGSMRVPVQGSISFTNGKFKAPSQAGRAPQHPQIPSKLSHQ